jgi:hypothetical protein
MSSSQDTAERGRAAVRSALESLGWLVKETTVDGRFVMHLTGHGLMRQVRVSAKRAGSWQSRTAYGMAKAEPQMHGRFWIFVDVGAPSAKFYVVPENWIVEGIFKAHQKYLARYGESRKRSPNSTHHAIPRDRIAKWYERWDLLEGASV